MVKKIIRTFLICLSSYQFFSCIFDGSDNEQIKVNTPSGGESFVMGEKIKVEWEFTGLEGEGVVIGLIGVDGSYQVLAGRRANDGSVLVTLDGHSVSGSGFRIQVRSQRRDIVGSSAEFSILPFNFIAPVENDTFTVGKRITIEWIGSLDADVSLDLYKGDIPVQSVTSSKQGYTTHFWKIPGELYTGSDYEIRITDNFTKESLNSNQFTIVNSWYDDFEPNGSLETANEIEVDGTLQSHFMAPLDEDFIFFKAKKGWIYKVHAYSALEFHLYIFENEQEISWIHGLNQTDWIYSSDTANYTFKIRRYASNDSGSYKISVQAYDPNGLASFLEPGLTTQWLSGTNQLIAWNPDSSIFGDKVKLDLMLGERILVQIDSTLNINGGIANNGQVEFTLPTGLATDNMYKIRMTNYKDDNIIGYSQEFSITGVASDEFEPNDLAEEPATIVPGESNLELTLSYKDKDWFSFKADSGKTYIMRTGDSLDFQIKAYYPEGLISLPNSVLTSNDSNTVFAWFCDKAGEYLFRITSSQTGEYFLNFNEHIAEEYQFNIDIPIEDEPFARSDTVAITWSNDLDMGGKVNINLYQGAELITTIQANTNNDGLFLWPVSSAITTGEGYIIKISHTISSSIFGESEMFSIKQE